LEIFLMKFFLFWGFEAVSHKPYLFRCPDLKHMLHCFLKPSFPWFPPPALHRRAVATYSTEAEAVGAAREFLRFPDISGRLFVFEGNNDAKGHKKLPIAYFRPLFYV